MPAQLLLKGYSSSSYSDTVCWSSDERIAVIADEFLFVITLKDAFQSPTPPVAISSIAVPSSLPTIQAPLQQPLNDIYKLFDSTDSYDVFFDPRMSANVTSIHFISAKWSPIGCSGNNRCVLCCLTNTNRILIYHQSLSTGWTIVTDLSAVHYQNLVDSNFTIEDTSPIEETPSQSTLTPLHEYHRQQSLLVATAISWLPILLNATTGSGREKVAVLAVAWRGGYISIWSIRVPIEETYVPSLVRMIPVQLHNGWVSTIDWCVSHTGSLYLSIGCSTGQVMLLEWRQETLGKSVELLTKHQPVMTDIWKPSDSMCVHLVTWSSLQVDDSRWLLFSKGSYLFGAHVSSSNYFSPCPLFHSNLPFSGVSVTSHNNDVISCSRDGRVNRRHLPEQSNYDTFVSIEEESLLIQHGIKSDECSGIACSNNGLFAVICVHTLTDGKRSCQVWLFPLCKPNDTSFTSQLKTETCSWDLYYYLRQSPNLWVESIEPPWPLMIQRQIILLKQDESRLLAIEQELLIEHCRRYLQEYIKWTHPIKETLSLVSISHNALFLLKHSGTINPSDRLLANKVLSRIGEDIVELCPICNEAVTYLSYKKGSCSNEHSWERCILTQCIVSDLACTVICSVCNSKATSNSSTNWLAHVMSLFQTCPLCGGHFESLL